MTVRDFYDEINESYDNVISRLRSDERIIKYLNLFLQDEAYPNLVKSIASQDYEVAFRMAHTLKGVASNFEFTHLYQVSSALTEDLRAHIYDDVEPKLAKVKAEYEKIDAKIKELLQ